MRAVRTVLYATLVVALAAPVVRAQSFNVLGAGMQPKTQDEVDEENRRNDDYKSSLNKLPDQNVKKDPWGNIRAGGTQSEQKQAGQKPKQADPKQKQAAQKPKQTGTQ